MLGHTKGRATLTSLDPLGTFEARLRAIGQIETCLARTYAVATLYSPTSLRNRRVWRHTALVGWMGGPEM